MRMLRLKYVRSPCRRSRTVFASWPTATTSGCSNSTRPSSAVNLSPRSTLERIASSISAGLRAEGGGTPRTADESLELAAFHQLGELQARPLSDTEDLS